MAYGKAGQVWRILTLTAQAQRKDSLDAEMLFQLRQTRGPIITRVFEPKWTTQSKKNKT